MTRPVKLWELNGRFCRLTRPKMEGGGTHDGVRLPDGTVLHITDARGLEVCRYPDFEQGRQVLLKATLDPRGNHEAWQRVQRLLLKNRPYDPATHNCETVARIVMGEPSVSPQALVWGAVAVAGAVFVATSR